MRKFDFVTRRYNTNCSIPVVPNCNCITITNIGDNTCNVDGPAGMILYPGTVGSLLGDSRTIGGNEDEILARKEIRIAFSQPETAGQLIEVVQKFYTR